METPPNLQKAAATSTLMASVGQLRTLEEIRKINDIEDTTPMRNENIMEHEMETAFSILQELSSPNLDSSPTIRQNFSG